MGTIKTTNIETITGSGTLTLGQSGETITIPSGVTITNNGTQTGFGGTMTPAFEAYASSDQTGLGDAVWTKLTIDTELFDTDSNFASSRFTPTTAGKYFVYLMVGMNSETLYKVNALNVSIYKNGSQYRTTNTTVNPSSDIMNEHNATVSAIIDFNGSSDYVEGYTRVNVTSGTGRADIRVGSGGFGAYRIIE